MTHSSLPPCHRWIPDVFTPEECARLAEGLEGTVSWERHRFRIFGKEMWMPREVAFYGPHAYGYSGTVHLPCPLPSFVNQVLDRVQEVSGASLNTVLLNRYRDGADSMGWHRDDDYPCGAHPEVVSLSLGATRFFRIRRRDKTESWKLALPEGGLFVMEKGSQLEFEHALPKTTRPVGERLNLTFRFMEKSNR